LHIALANYIHGVNRLTLNYKGIPYTIEWVDFTDIEAKYKEMGISPSETKPDGTPFCTLPAIWDPSTKTGVSGSAHIAGYLDKTYPATPRVWFDGIGDYNQITDGVFILPELMPLARFILPAVYENIVNPASKDYFRRTREARFGRKLEEVTPVGGEKEETWKQIRKGFDIIDGWLQKNGGPYALGEQVSYVDFSLGGYLIWSKIIWGEDSELWQDVLTWSDGRWKKYVENLEKYSEAKAAN
jgi:glutathione S-transferase